MWLITKLGAYSIVQKEGHFHIRARVRADLERLIAACNSAHERVSADCIMEGEIADANDRLEIEEWPQADYRYRIRIKGGESGALIIVMYALARSITYPNFKGEIARNSAQAGRYSTYQAIYLKLLQLEEARPRPHNSAQAIWNPDAARAQEPSPVELLLDALRAADGWFATASPQIQERPKVKAIREKIHAAFDAAGRDLTV